MGSGIDGAPRRIVDVSRSVSEWAESWFTVSGGVDRMHFNRVCEMSSNRVRV